MKIIILFLILIMPVILKLSCFSYPVNFPSVKVEKIAKGFYRPVANAQVSRTWLALNFILGIFE